MDNFKKLNDLNFNPGLMQNTINIDSTIALAENVSKRHNETMRQAQEAFEAKRDEELRRHNELVSALKSAAVNGATIVIGDNASEIQIQQNTSSSSQTNTNIQAFDYEKVLNVLKEVQGYFEYPQFATTFNDNSKMVKQIVNETINAAEKKEEPTLIKKSLNLLKDIVVESSGSLIASGILALLASVIK